MDDVNVMTLVHILHRAQASATDFLSPLLRSSFGSENPLEDAILAKSLSTQVSLFAAGHQLRATSLEFIWPFARTASVALLLRFLLFIPIRTFVLMLSYSPGFVHYSTVPSNKTINSIMLPSWVRLLYCHSMASWSSPPLSMGFEQPNTASSFFHNDSQDILPCFYNQFHRCIILFDILRTGR